MRDDIDIRVSAREVLRRCTVRAELRITVTGLRLARARLRVAAWIISLAAIVGGCRIDVITPEKLDK